MTRTVFAAGVVLACTLSVGCGAGVGGRYPTSGAVTYNGQPVPDGSILFVPAGGAAGGKPIRVGGPIKDGRYSIPAETGPVPGSYKVEISWMKPTGLRVKGIDEGAEADELGEVIPAKFNTSTTLTADVKPEKNVFDFTLSGEPLGKPVPRVTTRPDM